MAVRVILFANYLNVFKLDADGFVFNNSNVQCLVRQMNVSDDILFNKVGFIILNTSNSFN